MSRLFIYEVVREQVIKVSAKTPEDAAKIAVAGFDGYEQADGVEGGVFAGTKKDVEMTIRRDVV